MRSLSLGNDLSIETCSALKQRLDDGWQQPAPLLLDGSMIERIHTASLQLLCALFRSRQDAGHETAWAAASPVLRESARLLGLSATLGLLDDDIQTTSPLPLTQNQDHDMEIAA